LTKEGFNKKLGAKSHAVFSAVQRFIFLKTKTVNPEDLCLKSILKLKKQTPFPSTKRPPCPVGSARLLWPLANKGLHEAKRG
jgi:hypothetical protein